MSEAGVPAGTVTADDQTEAVVRLGSAKGGWWRQVGWRHLIAWIALFPILFLVSAAINPLGTLSPSQLIPTGASLENFGKLFDNTQYVNWYWTPWSSPWSLGPCRCSSRPARPTPTRASGSRAGAWGCWGCS
jgi:hypothetical protein